MHSRGGLVLFVFSVPAMLSLSILAGCKVTAETKDIPPDPTSATPTIKNKKASACTTFEGGKLSAVWTECPDKIRREVTCATFIDDLKCDCFEDGVQKTFFKAKDPPLQNRADATRVANANCHWSLETP